MKKANWVLIVVSLAMISVTAIWMIDVSLSALVSGGKLTNGFVLRDPAKTYHVGLYLLYASIASFVFVSVKFIMEGE